MVRWFPLCLLGCGDRDDKGATEDNMSDVETTSCIETVSEIGVEDSIDGFGSVADHILDFEVSGSTEGVYADGTTTMVFLETRFDAGVILLVDSEQNPDLSMEIDLGCIDRIEAEVDAELITSDDQVRVFRKIIGSVTLDGTVGLSATLNAADNTGMYDSKGGMYNVFVSIEAGQTQGEISVVTEGDEADVAWIENEVLLTWPIPI